MHYAFRFVLAVLAVWRVTHLLAKEDGSWRVFKRLRGTFLGPLLSCFYCLSMWVAVPFVWFTGGSRLERMVTWLALSGAAILLERATEEPFEVKIESEEEEPEHELLRAKRRAAGH